jgi:hypothetical protein
MARVGRPPTGGKAGLVGQQHADKCDAASSGLRIANREGVLFGAVHAG